jgi:hypothetical protein
MDGDYRGRDELSALMANLLRQVDQGHDDRAGSNQLADRSECFPVDDAIPPRSSGGSLAQDPRVPALELFSAPALGHLAVRHDDSFEGPVEDALERPTECCPIP